LDAFWYAEWEGLAADHADASGTASVRPALSDAPAVAEIEGVENTRDTPASLPRSAGASPGKEAFPDAQIRGETNSSGETLALLAKTPAPCSRFLCEETE